MFITEKMLGRDEIFDDLESLEERFEEAAKNVDLSDLEKCQIMARSLQRMLQTIRKIYQGNTSLGVDLADFALDFFQREDFAPRYLSMAFKNANGIERQSLEMQMQAFENYLLPKSSDVIARRGFGYA